MTRTEFTEVLAQYVDARVREQVASDQAEALRARLFEVLFPAPAPEEEK